MEAEMEAGGGGGDLARRSDRASIREAEATREKAVAAEKRARFEAAVEKGNWAARALKPLEVCACTLAGMHGRCIHAAQSAPSKQAP